MNYELIISPRAKNDLVKAYQYGLVNWGRSHALSYLNQIQAQLWQLTEQPKIGIERTALLLNMRSLVIKKHIVFYRIINNNIEIIRILHARQDPQLHVK